MDQYLALMLGSDAWPSVARSHFAKFGLSNRTAENGRSLSAGLVDSRYGSSKNGLKLLFLAVSCMQIRLKSRKEGE